MRIRPILFIVPAIAVCAAPVEAQYPRIGVVDFYGNRTVQESALRAALGVKEGDTLVIGNDSLTERIRRVTGVKDAHVAAVCCEAGRTIIYVGIREVSSANPRAGATPAGVMRLPPEIVAADNAAFAAMMEGIQKGVAGEDDTRGFTLYAYPPARAAQEAFIRYVPSHLAQIRNVLRNAGDADHRALAAQLLPFAGPSRQTVSDLVMAMRDPDSGVRNNAMRALGVIAAWAGKHPEAKLDVPVAGFAELLNSLIWTDRNKAAFALMSITESRDSATLQQLSQTSLDALSDMTRWKSAGHATPGAVVLGRIAGMTDEQIFQAIQGNRESIIGAAVARSVDRRR